MKMCGMDCIPWMLHSTIVPDSTSARGGESAERGGRTNALNSNVPCTTKIPIITVWITKAAMDWVAPWF